MNEAGGRPDLRLQQRSMWSAYPLDLLDPAGRMLGSLDWPGAQARGGDPGSGRTPRRALPLVLRHRHYHITQASLPQGWNSGRRLQLCGDDGAVLASVDIQVGAERRRALLRVTAPVQGELVQLPVRLRMACSIRLADGRQGSVQEPSWLSLRRTLDVRLPRSDDALRAFLGAAVLIARTSNTSVRW